MNEDGYEKPVKQKAQCIRKVFFRVNDNSPFILQDPDKDPKNNQSNEKRFVFLEKRSHWSNVSIPASIREKSLQTLRFSSPTLLFFTSTVFNAQSV